MTRPAIAASRPASLISSRHFQRARNRHRGEVGDRHAIHFHRQTLRPQPLALARRTLRRRHVIHQPVAITLRRRLFQILFQISEDAVEAGLAAASRFAIQQKVLRLLRKFFERRTQIDAVRRRRNLQLVNQILRRRTRPQPAIKQRLRPVGNHLRRIEIVLAAQPVALRASSIHAVERKRPRLQLRHADAAIRTRQLLRIKLSRRRRPPRPAPARPPASSPARPTFPAGARSPASPASRSITTSMVWFFRLSRLTGHRRPGSPVRRRCAPG